MKNDEFTWLGAIRVFWALTWRTLLIGVPLAVFIGVIFGFVSAFIGIPQDKVGLYGGVIGQIIILPVYIFVIKRLFNKGFGKYRLQVVEKE
jgi:hypothetical protein